MEKPLAKRKPTQSTNLSAEMNAYVMKGLGPRMLDESAYAGGGGKLARSETVTVRLDPKLRYLAELAALKHRRTLSSYIEWAIEDSLSRVQIREGSGYNNDMGSTVAGDAEYLWDVDDSDRF